MIVLISASLLGLLIGLSAMYLLRVQKEKGRLSAIRSQLKSVTNERDSLLSETGSLQKALETEQRLKAKSREKLSHVVAQQEALEVHAQLQTQTLAKRTSELHVAEEKCMRLQRDFANFKANKLREMRMLKVSPEEWLDNEELPVLSKRVNRSTDSAQSEQPDPDLTQPIIASELDIPSLAESELPDSVEELEFELVDSRTSD